MFSRLNHWKNQIIPSDFEIEQMPRAKYGLADYLSRHPEWEASRLSWYDTTFKLAKSESNRSFLW